LPARDADASAGVSLAADPGVHPNMPTMSHLIILKKMQLIQIK
jgi:hypothetical protein